MTPVGFIQQLSDSVGAYPVVALLVAVAGGIFSTST